MQRHDGPRDDLKVAAAAPVGEMDAIIGTNFLPEPRRTIVNGNLSRLARSSWLRCAAHEYRMAAAGHCHLLLYNKLRPRDHAPGWLLHREGELICAPNEASWRLARDALLDSTKHLEPERPDDAEP